MTVIPPIEDFDTFKRDTLALISPFVSKFGAMPLSELDKKGPEHEHLVKGILTRGEVSMLVGPSGSGKSFMATDISLRIGRGIAMMPVLIAGKPIEPRVRRGGVIYIAGEGARGLRKRLRAYVQEFGVRPEDVPFILLTKPVDLHNSDEHTNLLIAEAKHHSAQYLLDHGVKLELVVLDTLAASTPGANENASDDVSRVLGRCHRIAQECDCAVMLVHHMNATGLRERGHSSLRANVDSVIEVQKTDRRDASGKEERPGRAIRLAKVTKQKDGEDGVSWEFVLLNIKVGEDSDGDPITSCVVEVPDTGERAPQAEKRYRLSLNEAKIFRALLTALREHGGEPPDDVDVPERVLRVVDYDFVKRQVLAEELKDEPDSTTVRDKIKTMLKRSRPKLIDNAVIAHNGQWVWWTGRPVEGFYPKNLIGTRYKAEAESETKDAGDTTGSW